MATNNSEPLYLVYTPEGAEFARTPDSSAAALLMSLYGNGSTIRVKHRVVWFEGSDGEGAESYDNVYFTIKERLK
jgi:hypothetical protein